MIFTGPWGSYKIQLDGLESEIAYVSLTQVGLDEFDAGFKGQSWVMGHNLETSVGCVYCSLMNINEHSEDGGMKIHEHITRNNTLNSLAVTFDTW